MDIDLNLLGHVDIVFCGCVVLVFQMLQIGVRFEHVVPSYQSPCSQTSRTQEILSYTRCLNFPFLDTKGLGSFSPPAPLLFLLLG